MDFPKLVEHPTFGDHRGNFCASPIQMMSDKRLDKNWVQVNTSISIDPFTLRGLHFQNHPFEQTKYMKPIWGSILNFVICVDKKRPDFGKVYSFNIDVNHAVLIPRGFANGVLTLEPNTIIQYFVDNSFSKEHDQSLKWDSHPEIKSIVNRLTYSPTISEKDENGFLWDDLVSEKYHIHC
jgi:dTDP-4-dehydrorhamnose 3,5-epimerase